MVAVGPTVQPTWQRMWLYMYKEALHHDVDVTILKVPRLSAGR